MLMLWLDRCKKMREDFQSSTHTNVSFSYFCLIQQQRLPIDLKSMKSTAIHVGWSGMRVTVVPKFFECIGGGSSVTKLEGSELRLNLSGICAQIFMSLVFHLD